MKPLATLVLLATAASAIADEFDTWGEPSPDKSLFAIERRIPDPTEPSRFDLDGFAVFICKAEVGPRSVAVPREVIARLTWRFKPS